MSYSSFLSLSNEEKGLFLQSVAKLTGKLDSLVERFYYHFLNDNEEISQLFQSSDMVKQHNMFNVSIGYIITNIDDPNLIQVHLDQLIDNHLRYGIKVNHIPFFTSAFSKTITELLDSSDPVSKIWIKVIESAMEYFKFKLEKVD